MRRTVESSQNDHPHKDYSTNTSLFIEDLWQRLHSGWSKRMKTESTRPSIKFRSSAGLAARSRRSSTILSQRLRPQGDGLTPTPAECAQTTHGLDDLRDRQFSIVDELLDYLQQSKCRHYLEELLPGVASIVGNICFGHAYLFSQRDSMAMTSIVLHDCDLSHILARCTRN